jgi:hypothetical protein
LSQRFLLMTNKSHLTKAVSLHHATGKAYIEAKYNVIFSKLLVFPTLLYYITNVKPRNNVQYYY